MRASANARLHAFRCTGGIHAFVMFGEQQTSLCHARRVRSFFLHVYIKTMLVFHLSSHFAMKDE